ncbi:YveK family protein [Alkalihalobacillus hemicellulosilyticus]|uniref:Tyrosine-protein kinase transmembrane modulator EpsC n=1 Tax=Halalkalibacter hemicellulosilyticusJCM 9152 TaxID=1236971 RepID=W4QGY1_9BACI|nr:Wzz/FepE/Etk N-terminal domain-containing protein [Halalkalibacter hemicellulosilyticus]GAE31341.1 tyrosine-protein kinase transmembrane modulator EpsC [Halalkalibacter hemicellulosilyticusJCM 9152]
MEETISLKDIMLTIKKHLRLIILIPIVAVVVSALASYLLLTPIFQSSTQILVNQTNGDQQISQNEIRTNIEIINTYTEIIREPIILDKVIEEASLTESVSQLRGMISVSPQNNSQVVRISVDHEQPAQAALIANTVAEVFQREIVEIMNIDNVHILSYAEVGDSPSPVAPNPTLNMAIAFVVGLMAAVGVASYLNI